MSEIIWPKKNVKLFTDDGDYYEHAHFGWGDFDTIFSGYQMGYKDAADTLIDHAVDSRSIQKLDTFIFPILFLYRQYLELELKWIYIRYSEDVKEEKIKVIKNYKHDLIKIWNRIKPMLIEFASKEDIETVDIVENYIQDFHLFDVRSFTFRFPIDKNLEEVLKGETRINYLNLKQRMAELELFFGGVTGHLDSVLNYKTDMSLYFN